MRQVLFRLRLDDLFSTEPIDGMAAVGIGWLLVPWLVYFVGWLYVNRARLTPTRETAAAVAPLFVLPAIVLGAWLVGGSSGAARKGIPLYGYGLMLCLGFLAGCWMGARRVRRLGIDPETAWDLGLWLFGFGLLGARLFYILQYPGRVFFHPDGSGKSFGELLAAPFSLWDGGLVVVGCIPFAVAGFFLFCHRRKLRPLALGDAVIPSFFIGLAIGRIGCLLNGCCWGDRCDLPWAISFPKGGGVTFTALMNAGFLPADATWTFPLHPTQLYSSLNALILAAVTAAYFRTRPRPGSVAAMGCLLYPISRFLIEFLRGDEMGQFGTALTISQWYCIGLFGVGLVFTAWLNRHRTIPRPGRVAAQAAAQAEQAAV